eukprot:SAG31_NODE_8993_length_1351_cov_1.322684_2_plen_208_part_00
MPFFQCQFVKLGDVSLWMLIAGQADAPTQSQVCRCKEQKAAHLNLRLPLKSKPRIQYLKLSVMQRPPGIFSLLLNAPQKELKIYWRSNNNSSRFGKYLELMLNHGTEGHIAGAMIATYMLERPRVTKTGKEERNYHIFYQLLTGKIIFSTTKFLRSLFMRARLSAPYACSSRWSRPSTGEEASNRSRGMHSGVPDSFLWLLYHRRCR